MKGVLTVLVVVAVGVAGFLAAKATNPSSTTSSTFHVTTTTSSTSTTSSNVAACAGVHFSAAVATGQGAAGHVFTSVTLTNHGATCSTNGWPTVTVADASGKSINVHVVQDGSFFNSPGHVPLSPGAITVPSGASATFALAYGDVGSGGCAPVATMHIGLPNDIGGSATISTDVSSLQINCSSDLVVSPIYR